ncbi:MAG: hypothetical protein KF726_25880 [Anaerolineae bacterium]|nr:hypothetical protein [Anaerolineae bacterium]
MLLRRLSFPALIAILLILLTITPYVLAIASAPTGATFSGVLANPVDFNSHLAKMQQGLRGEWLYSLLFTTEPHQPAFLQTFYVALGHVARITGLSLEVTFHLARLIGIALMVWGLWSLLRVYLEESPARWSLLLAIFGGGIGYLLYFVAPQLTAAVSPIELWLQDGYIFLAVFSFPHFAAALALLFWCFVFLNRQQWIGVLITSALLGFIQPFLLPFVDIQILLFIAWNVWRRKVSWKAGLLPLILLGVIHLPILGYQYVILYTWEVWKEFTAQNITLSPTPLFYIFGYAPLLLPALGGLWIALRRRGEMLDRWLLPMAWLILTAILLYAPLATQRRYSFGVQAPLAALAVMWFTEAGIPYLRRHWRKRWKLSILVYGAVAVLSTLILYYSVLLKVRDTRDPETYISDDVSAALAWVRSNTEVTDSLLSGFRTGGQIAARTGRRVVLGHWIETINYDQVRAEVSRFFQPETEDQWRYQFLSEQGIHYVWYGEEERKLGTWQPSQLRYLVPVFEDETVTIYRMDWVF